MNQVEIKELFIFCENTFKNFKAEDCDESSHYYLNDVFIGGYAGDANMFFLEQNDEVAEAIQMMDVQNKIQKGKKNKKKKFC